MTTPIVSPKTIAQLALNYYLDHGRAISIPLAASKLGLATTLSLRTMLIDADGRLIDGIDLKATVRRQVTIAPSHKALLRAFRNAVDEGRDRNDGHHPEVAQ